MKPIKTKSNKTLKLFRVMDMDITEQQLKQAKAWYLSAKKCNFTNKTHKPH